MAEVIGILRQIEQFDLKPHKWESWRQRFEMYPSLQKDLTPTNKTAQPRLSLAPPVFDVFNRICKPTPIGSKSCDDLPALLDVHYGKDKLSMAEQYRLYTSRQQS